MENNTKGAGDDYPIIPQPLNKNKEFLNWIYERMICVHGEKDLYDYMINFKSIIDSQVDIQNELTSLREQNEILRQSYKYIHESRSKAAAELNEKEKELASLKEENAKLKFRADLMAIYKQEKEDRDKILHQIKCTLYDRLTETEKLNDILKFFPTVLKTFSDNK